MVSKCANPACKETFRYLHQGKLFRFEWTLTQESSLSTKDGRRHVEFYWLCEGCAEKMTIVYKIGSGVTAVGKPLKLPAAS